MNPDPQWFVDLAREAAISPDPSTKNAAGLLNRFGRLTLIECNQLIHPSFDRLLTDREAKYGVMVHAEEAVCTRMPNSSKWCQMVALWAACPTCARLIVRSRIDTVYTLAESNFPGGWPERWKKSVDLGRKILAVCHVEVIDVKFGFTLGARWLWNGQEIEI
jgi:hypothetical protein